LLSFFLNAIFYETASCVLVAA